MTETMFPRHVDPVTLKTIGEKTRLTDYHTLNTASAHPQVLQDGTILTMGGNYRHKKGPHYLIVKVPPTYESDGQIFCLICVEPNLSV
jgi:hypothetical protein